MSTTTANKQLTLPAYNQTSPTWDIPLNANFSTIDAAFGSTTSVAVTNSNVTLTSTQSQNLRILFTGVLSNNLTITFPAEGGQWVVSNFTGNDINGPYTITLASGGSGSNAVLAPQGFNVIVYSDGNGIFYSNDGIGGGGGGGGGGGAVDGIFYLNNQTVTASYTVPTAQNAMTAGPITVASGVTVTVSGSSVWTIV
jgi:hypothetical protein